MATVCGKTFRLATLAIKALAIKALQKLYEGTIEALWKLYQGSIKALLILLLHDSLLQNIEVGDVIVDAKVVDGLDNLVAPK